MGIPAFSQDLLGEPDAIGAISTGKRKHKDYDVSALEALSQDEQRPSPQQGAASQGAVGDPASAGKAPAPDGALQGESPQDMLSIFKNASDEDRQHLVESQRESLAPHGVSLDGGVEKILTEGGPQAWARAAKFGIDLTVFADKLSPKAQQKADASAGQAFGLVPTEEQSASGEAFKSQEQAVGDMNASIKDAAASKKKEQNAAMAAFIMETGLRILASTRPDAAGAFGEGVLGTMDATRGRNRQAAQDKLDAAERERKIRREDESDEMARQKATLDRQKYEEDKEREDIRLEREGLVKMTDEDTRFAEYVKIKEGLITNSEGVPIRQATSSELSAAQRRTREDNLMRLTISERNRIRTALEEGYTDNPEIQAIMDQKDPDKKRQMINDLADKNLEVKGINGSSDGGSDGSVLDWNDNSW